MTVRNLSFAESIGEKCIMRLENSRCSVCNASNPTSVNQFVNNALRGF